MEFEKNIYMQESLLPLALEKMRGRHEIDTNNPKTLLKLLKILRMLGQLDEAKIVCEQILSICDDIQTKRTLSILSGLIPFSDGGLNSSPPYVYKEDFLDRDQQKKIWNNLDKQQKNLIPSFTHNAETPTEKSNTRRSQVLYSQYLQSIRPWFLKCIFHSVEEYFSNLEQSPYSSFREELQLTRSGDGDYFKAHKDAGENDSAEDFIMSRKTSFVYYFFSEPKYFEGGDLLLFDEEHTSTDLSHGYTRIAPQNNSLILFPSNRTHMVTPVRMIDNKFINGRFTLNGWLHKNTD